VRGKHVRPMKRGTIQIGCGIIVLWVSWPMISVFVAAVIASAWGCPLDEGGAHPCVVLGLDIGGLLYSMGVMGWLFIVTLPTGLIALVVLLVAVMIGALVKRRPAMTLSLVQAEESAEETPNPGPEADT
jgi:hypothetical protein